MAFSFNGLSATVTISGGVSTLPTSTTWDKTLIAATIHGQFGVAAADVYQAGAGNVDIITEIEGGYFHTNAANEGLLITVTDSANAVIKTIFDSRDANNSGQAATWIPFKFTMPIVLNSQEKIRRTGGLAGTYGYIRVLGFRES